jgi:hypothetical protein
MILHGVLFRNTIFVLHNCKLNGLKLVNALNPTRVPYQLHTWGSAIDLLRIRFPDFPSPQRQTLYLGQEDHLQ